MQLDDASQSVQLDDSGRLAGHLPEAIASASMALARRFSTNATLWCWSPRWPQHAQHVAVEFVHPVIVGKRALPAVAVADADPVAALRTLVEAGDVLLVVAAADTRRDAAVLQRAPAWGIDTIWIGAGPRPDAAAADHCCGSTPSETKPRSMVPSFSLYHVLWELTHVCFEHPGLLRQLAEDEECTDGHCIICADEGQGGRGGRARRSLDRRGAQRRGNPGGRHHPGRTRCAGRSAPGARGDSHIPPGR